MKIYKILTFIHLFISILYCALVNNHNSSVYIVLIIAFVNFFIFCMIIAWQDVNKLAKKAEEREYTDEELIRIDSVS